MALKRIPKEVTARYGSDTFCPVRSDKRLRNMFVNACIQFRINILVLMKTGIERGKIELFMLEPFNSANYDKYPTASECMKLCDFVGIGFKIGYEFLNEESDGVKMKKAMLLSGELKRHDIKLKNKTP